jgi:Flp pilus assembly protein TadG
MTMLHRFLGDSRGNVLMLTGLAFFVIIAIAGAGIDFGRQQLMRIRLQQATDAAALAAANMPVNTPETVREARALRYYQLNMPSSYLGLARPDPVITITDTITVEADRTLATNFISSVNVNQLQATGRTVVQRARDAITNYDVLLVMDNSGSMSRADVGSGSTTPAANASEATQLGRNYCQQLNRVKGQSQQVCPQWYQTWGLSSVEECVSAIVANCPTNAADYGVLNDTRLNALRFSANRLVDTLMTEDSGNRVGLVSWSTSLLGTQVLTEDTGIVHDFINRLYAHGATSSNAGLAAAETQINAAIADDAGNNRVRAIVLLTDGFNTVADAGSLQYQYVNPSVTYPTAPGVSEPYPGSDRYGCNRYEHCAEADTQTLAICTRLKAQNVQIYTIAFGGDVTSGNTQGPAARALMQACATPDAGGVQHFFPIATARELDEIFQQITTQIQELRIAE